MEYNKIINLLDNAPNQPTSFRTKNWVEINVERIKFKTSVLMSSLCDYSDAYIREWNCNSCSISSRWRE